MITLNITTAEEGNIAPSIAVLAPDPASGLVYTSLDPITLTFSASDVDGTVAQVEVTAEGQTTILVTAPYTMTWTPSTYGVYEVTARAKDNEGRNSGGIGMVFTIEEPSGIVKFVWPMVLSGEDTDFNYWKYAGYFDHDSRSGWENRMNYLGTKESLGDGHKGADLSPWPFEWVKKRNGRVDVVAAADGVITGREDGAYDEFTCGVTGAQNAIYLKHKDGKSTLYIHLGNGSVTSKQVGDSVKAGEYLGKVASSGNSSGPHLHFEVWDENGKPIDPFYGPANDDITESLWIDQKPFQHPELNKIMISNENPYYGSCDHVEYTYEKTGPLVRGEFFYVYRYYPWTKEGLNSQLEMIQPDGTVWAEWNHDHGNNHAVERQDWGTMPHDAQTGTWMFRETYNGVVYEKTFEVAAENASPIIEMISPVQSETVPFAPVTFKAEASDPNGTVDYVVFRFFDGEREIQAKVTSEPYEFTYTPKNVGEVTVICSVIDNWGKLTTTEGVSYIVSSSCSLPEWDATEVYLEGDEVQVQGIAYRAKHWTKRNPVQPAGAWMAWEDLGDCSAGSSNARIAFTSHNSAVTISPNPATESLTISANGTATIYNVLGNKIAEYEVEKELEIQVSDWESGVYLLKVGNEEMVRFVKQ